MQGGNFSLLESLGETRLIRPLQSKKILEDIKDFNFNHLALQFSSQLYSELHAALLSWLNNFAPSLKEFPYFYLTGGILEFLNIEGNLGQAPIYLIEGDFSYLHDINPNRCKIVSSSSEVPNGAHLYLSAPSARDGQIPKDVMEQLNERQVTQYLDLAYACTVSSKSKVSSLQGADRVYISLSKLIGIPALRQGFILSRKPIRPLDFLIEKQYVSLLLAPFYIYFFQKYSASFLFEELSYFQQKAALALGVTPSDSVLLAYTKDPRFNHWRRGDVNRVYLGNYMYQTEVEVRKGFNLV